jgi:hypothetical protein
MYDPFLSRDWGEGHATMSAGIDRLVRRMALLLRRRPTARADEPELECRPGTVRAERPGMLPLRSHPRPRACQNARSRDHV